MCSEDPVSVPGKGGPDSMSTATLPALREKEREARRELILSAARKLFAEKDFRSVTVREIAKAVEVSPGTIYRYYASKEELINALYVREKRRINAQILEGVHAGLSVRDAIARIFRNVLGARESAWTRWRFPSPVSG